MYIVKKGGSRDSGGDTSVGGTDGRGGDSGSGGGVKSGGSSTSQSDSKDGVGAFGGARFSVVSAAVPYGCSTLGQRVSST